MKDTEVKDFCCIHGFIDKIVDKICNHLNDDHYSIDIIANGDLAQDLIRCLMAVQTDSDGFMFDFGMVDFNSIEYGKEYIVTVNNDLELWCEPAYRDNEYSTGYIYAESDDCFVYEDSNREVMDKIESGNVTIFGFKGDNEFEN
jgi:hypothetical protein